jgi:protein AroM
MKTLARRVAFVTIGQSPRPDLVPEMLAEARIPITPCERGVLDRLDDAEVAELAPKPGEECLVSRLRDGREVFLAKPAIERRLQTVLGEIDRMGFDLVILLCTGRFGGFGLATPFIEPQHTVDHFVRGLAYGRDRIGLLLPHPQQIADFHGIPGLSPRFAAASPYVAESEAELDAAAAELSESGMIVMHCMGYSEAMRRRVAAAARCPVLLSRRLVAHAIEMMLS